MILNYLIAKPIVTIRKSSQMLDNLDWIMLEINKLYYVALMNLSKWKSYNTNMTF